jgi:L-ascorbate metabolism protein UlaG (beta-lactamase superfamily)
MRLVSLFSFLLSLLAGLAQAAPASQCLAIARASALFQPAAYQLLAAAEDLAEDEVSITFVGHSTFRIETAGGITVATDYNGNAGGPAPTAVTMNRAHTSHFTESPDPAIKHVLRGWSEDGVAAHHDLSIGDLRIRNVTTDIRNSFTTRITDGNSIFIFEAGGLCIGHLGHLHHELTPGHIGWIGRLDVVMVPVDGRMTMPHANMMAVLRELRVSTIIPMHIFGPRTLADFLAEARKHFQVKHHNSRTVVASLRNLPAEPTVVVLPGY